MFKFLIVDDLPGNRKLLRKMLSKIYECEIIEALNGEEALNEFQKIRPDLILMDINMPVMNGYEAAKAIKDITGKVHTPVIFVTASSEESSLSASLSAGGDDFISKPFDFAVLESKINAHLRIKELNNQLNNQNEELTKLNRYLSHEQSLIEHFFHTALEQSYLDEKFVRYHMSAQSTFNGDILLIACSATGGFNIIMGDFTGHGLTAAMGTLPVAMMFFNMSQNGDSISFIATEINHQLNKLLPTGIFLAASIININLETKEMSVWMGGMPELYWFSVAHELKNTIYSQHMPLGIQPNERFDQTIQTFNIDLGDKLYLYSDGIIEAMNEQNEMFGNKRLKQYLLSGKDNRFDDVLSSFKNFKGNSTQEDDISFVEITCQQ